LRAAIASFPAGSSAGPDGLRPIHLKSLIGNKVAGPDLVSALTAFTNLLLAGKCPTAVAKQFYGGNLIAINKNNGDLRPIVIGFVFRRLASKVANSFGLTRASQFLSPLQIGAGIKGGCDAAIHAARRFVQNMGPDDVFVKIDFCNAFNSIHREVFFNEVNKLIPEILPYVLSAYSSPSLLLFGSKSISSEEGTQQGDPLGALLFCLAIQPLLVSLKSKMIFGYLDDITLGGNASTVADDVSRLVVLGEEIGLKINFNKSEVHTASEINVLDDAFLRFTRVDKPNLVLLGAPLFSGQALNCTWDERCADLYNAIARLLCIPSQDALILLRSSLGAPKIQHLLRCSLDVDHPGITRFDVLQRQALSSVANVILSDLNWTQASLPIKEGGLGIRKAADTAAPALLSSLHSTRPLQDAILCNIQLDLVDEARDIKDKWSAAYGSLPTGADASKQSAWIKPVFTKSKNEVVSCLSNEREIAVFKAAGVRHSGDWLLTLPISSCGLRLEDESVRIAIAMRLGLNICQPHKCKCGSDVDSYASHAFVCKLARAKGARHSAVNDIIARTLVSAGTPITKEPNGLIIGDSRRPDGLTLVPWSQGKSLAWDATISTPLAASYISSSARAACSSAEAAELKKIDKYAALAPGFTFQAVSLDSLGGYSQSTACFLNELGRRLSTVTSDSLESAHLWQRLSICLTRFNAVLLRESFIDEIMDPDE